MTTALVLAAGLGRRLRPVTQGPKWLVPVGDRSPARQQIAACVAAPEIDRMVVVAGPDRHDIASVVEAHREQVPIDVVENHDSDRWNNWSSALIGFEALAADEAVLLMNSDVFAAVGWFRSAIQALYRASTPALVIDVERPLTDEAMKVAGRDRLHAIGKVGVENPVGEYVGLAWWPAGQRSGITRRLAAYRDDASAAQNWYEHAIAADIDDGTPYQLIEAPSSQWVEMDDPADVDVARSLDV